MNHITFQLKNLTVEEPPKTLLPKIIQAVEKDWLKIKYRRRFIFGGLGLALANWIVMAFDTPPHGKLLETLHIHPLLKLINGFGDDGILYLFLVSALLLAGLASAVYQLWIEKKLARKVFGLSAPLLVFFIIAIELTNITVCSGAIVAGAFYHTKKENLPAGSYAKTLHKEAELHFQ